MSVTGTTRPFAYNPSLSPISGTTEYGDIVVGDIQTDYTGIQQIVNLVHQIKHLVASHLTRALTIWALVLELAVQMITKNYYLGAYNSRNKAYLLFNK